MFGSYRNSSPVHTASEEVELRFRVSATLAVCALANDAGDAARTLDILGLDPQEVKDALNEHRHSRDQDR